MVKAGRDVFFHVSVNATRETRRSWGDTQYAEGLIRALRQNADVDAEIFFRDEAPQRRGRNDVVLRIVGPLLQEPVPGYPNLLWIISPPALSPSAMLARFQAVFSASRVFVDLLNRHGIAAQFLPQATEGGHFHPDRRLPGAAEIPILFVGGHAARADRPLVRAANAHGFDVAVWGPGWSGIIPAHHLRGERLDYDALAVAYACARVVLNSHMPSMTAGGYMSNRTFDALSSGAFVLSDHIPGFQAPQIPELIQVRDDDHMVATLSDLLARPAPDHAARVALHDRLHRVHDFSSSAAVLIAAARGLLADGQVTPRVMGAASSAGPAGRATIQLDDPARSDVDQQQATLRAARDIVAIAQAAAMQPPPRFMPPRPALQQGVIHPLMADLRQVQKIAQSGLTAETEQDFTRICLRARRLKEIETEPVPALAVHLSATTRDRVMARMMDNQPLWIHGPQGLPRDAHKQHIKLRPRQDPVNMARPVGVFLHLYYDDLASVFAEKVALIDAPVRLYVSTDSQAKAVRLRALLPQADIRVFDNRGRDIWPKLYGFGDAYAHHDIVLHLHGKKSAHADQLNDWLDHILNCVIASRQDVNRILSMFMSVPTLGMVAPVAFRPLIGAAHWAANRDIARELAFRWELPDDIRLRFPMGSMFWARVSAIRPLLDLALTPDHFPPEMGQTDGTLAHAVERMLGVTCMATGHRMLTVSGSGQTLHARHQRRFDSNRALRDAVTAGEFDA